MPAFFMKGLKRPKISISRWEIVEKELPTFLAGFGENVGVASEPCDEAAHCEFSKGWRIEMKHRAMRVVLDLFEDCVARFYPMVIDVV
jgi:hypothetical protein